MPDVEKKHSTLSPSSSGRWLNCFGSVAANAGNNKRSSIYAEEGTAAHHLVEMCLRLDAEPLDFLGTHIYKDFEVTEEMAEAVGQAMDYVRAYMAKHPKAKMSMEKNVDPASILKCEKDYTSGTLDISIDNDPEELVLIDYKHGAGVSVEVEDSTQIRIYALGYIAQYTTRPRKRYRLIIIQPRSRHVDGPVREVVLTHEELMEFAAYVRGQIKAYHKNPDKRVAGKWCKFCAVEGRCKTLTEASMRAAAMEFKDKKMKNKPVDPQELDAEELAHALLAWDTFIESWGKALYAAALEFMLKGGELEGFKLVRGRSTRFWKDEKKVAVMLMKTFKFEPNEIAPRSLVGITVVEKLFRSRITVRGRKKDPLPPPLKKLIDRSEAKLHVAHEDDTRERVTRGEEFLGK